MTMTTGRKTVRAKHGPPQKQSAASQAADAKRKKASAVSVVPVAAPVTASGSGSGSGQLHELPTANAISSHFYWRFFPDKYLIAKALLDKPELAAYVDLVNAYALAGGKLSAEPKHLARVCELTVPQWQSLRHKLLQHGLGRIEGGSWVDDYQQANIDGQKRGRLRSLTANQARWGGTR